ncbi:hypothetical protein CCYA_CCYA01G0015 [Cyanidiococcus yangmingshanensis]|nr:hypothetical protein CCYA_CCYA01G0015 [Cyanidiococcus yangmingshanensis]
MSQRPGNRTSWQVIDDCALLNAYGFLTPSLQARAIADLEQWLLAFTLGNAGTEAISRACIQLVFIFPSAEMVHWGARSPRYRELEAKQRRTLERAWRLLQTGTTTGDRAALLAGKRRMAKMERIVYPAAVWWQLQQTLQSHDWKGAHLTFLDSLEGTRTSRALPWLVAADLFAGGFVDAVYAPKREALVLANVPEAVLLLNSREKPLASDRSMYLIEFIAGWPLSFALHGAQACALAGLEPLSRATLLTKHGVSDSSRFEYAMALTSQSEGSLRKALDAIGDFEHSDAEESALAVACLLVTGPPSSSPKQISFETEPSTATNRHSKMLTDGASQHCSMNDLFMSPRNAPSMTCGSNRAESCEIQPTGASSLAHSVLQPASTMQLSSPTCDVSHHPGQKTGLKPANTVQGTWHEGETTEQRDGTPITETREPDERQAAEMLIARHAPPRQRRSANKLDDATAHVHHHDWLPLIDTPYLRSLSGQALAWRKATTSFGSHSQWFSGHFVRWNRPVEHAPSQDDERVPKWLQDVLERARATDKRPILQALEALGATSLEGGWNTPSSAVLWPWVVLVLALALGWFATDAHAWNDRLFWWTLTDKKPVDEANAAAMTNYLLTHWPLYLAEQIAASELMRSVLGVQQPALLLATCVSRGIYAQLRERFRESIQHIRCYLDEETWSALQETLATPATT